MAETRLPFQCITWKGFGKTQIKIIIQKLKERKWRQTKERVREKEEKRRRRKRKRGESPKFTVSLTELQLIFHMTRVIFCVRCPTAVRPPPHHQIGSDRLVLLHFFFFFFMIQLYCKNLIFFCVWIIWDVFWEWSKVRSACSSQQLCFFLFCFSVFFFFFFFFKGSDSKGTVRNGLITVLRTVRLNRGSNGFLLFWHWPVLKLIEPWL